MGSVMPRYNVLAPGWDGKARQGWDGKATKKVTRAVPVKKTVAVNVDVDVDDDEEGGFGCVLLNACGLSIFIAGLNSRRVWVGSVGCVL